MGIGARSPSGLTALQVTMSARAGKFAPRESHLIDKAGEPIATARLASIADNVQGLERFVALGVPPLLQAAYPWIATGATRPKGTGTIPAFVAVPSEGRPGFDRRIGRHLLEALEARTRVPLDPGRSRLVLGCRGGGVTAFKLGMDELAKGADAVLVGGIDSYFDPGVLEWLDVECRLHGLDTENGFVPGEGAAFVLMVPRRRASSFDVLAQVISAAVETEPHPYGSEQPCLGEGLTKAVRRAVAPVGARSKCIPWCLTDVANERHRVDEWMAALGRNHRAFVADPVHDQPLLKTGDVGAASAEMLAAIAVTQWQTRCSEGDVALIATASDGPERGAMLLSVSPAS